MIVSQDHSLDPESDNNDHAQLLARLQRDGVEANNDLVLVSEVLFKGRKFVQIAHNGALYKLQVTKQGKLILTK